MIQALNRENEAAFRVLCDREPLFGAEVCTHLDIYGRDSREVRFWLAYDGDGMPTAAILSEQSRVRIAALPGADPEEIGAFLEAAGWSQVRTEAGFCGKLGFRGIRFSAPAMRYAGERFGGGGEVEEGLSLDELHRLLCISFPGFSRTDRGFWYTYVSHLFRHGLGFAVCVRRGGVPVATGGVYAWGPDRGVIASVATHPAHRGEGLGALVVRYLCDRILASGKKPVLHCIDESLESYYASLGFVSFARWGGITCG